MARPNEFSPPTKAQALSRQGYKCASCGTQLAALGEAARETHRFGEAAHAHHVLQIIQGGSRDVSNCVIVCQACHYSAHQGGNYRDKSVRGRPSDYPHFGGR